MEVGGATADAGEHVLSPSADDACAVRPPRTCACVLGHPRPHVCRCGGCKTSRDESVLSYLEVGEDGEVERGAEEQRGQRDHLGERGRRHVRRHLLRAAYCSGEYGLSIPLHLVSLRPSAPSPRSVYDTARAPSEDRCTTCTSTRDTCLLSSPGIELADQSAEARPEPKFSQAPDTPSIAFDLFADCINQVYLLRTTLSCVR